MPYVNKESGINVAVERLGDVSFERAGTALTYSRPSIVSIGPPNWRAHEPFSLRPEAAMAVRHSYPVFLPMHELRQRHRKGFQTLFRRW